MKTFSKYALAAALTLFGFLPNAWAGMNYTQNHDQFRAEKAEKAPSGEESKRFEHSSKYQRDQRSNDNILPTRERDLDRPTPRSDVTK